MAPSTIDARERTERGNRYGPTAARPEGRRPPRPSTTTIDIHSHVAVPEATKVAGPHVDRSAIPALRFVTERTAEINRNQESDRLFSMTDMDDRLSVLDAMEIDLQVVAPPPPQCFPTVPVEHAIEAIGLVNQGIAEFVARRPDRFAGLGTATMQDPDQAVADLETVMGPLGLKGVMILTSYRGEEISDPRFEPFWAKAEELGALVMIHPNGFSGGERLTEFYFTNVVGNPLDTTVALHHLIFRGVLERYPNLKILASHGGGYLPAYAGRIDHAWGAREDAEAGLPKPPTHYLRKVYFDSIVFTPVQLEFLVRQYGADHVLMGTDYPFDMGEYDPVGHVMVTEGLTDAEKSVVAGEAAKTLLGL